MLLSIDWDAYSGCRELVFDAPIWGTPDREADRLERWRERATKRGGEDKGGWASLQEDFPLYGQPLELLRYAGLPAYSAWSHAHAWEWLEQYPGQAVLNIDSHHDLYSQSGDPQRLRPGNWAGLGLARGLISRYTVQYPGWHAGLPVTEGYDLARTHAELEGAIPELLPRVTLQRDDALPAPQQVTALLLVQSPSWTSPVHDPVWFEVLQGLQAVPLSASYQRFSG